MSDVRIQLNTKKFNRALTTWTLNSKRSGEEILNQQAKLFVEDAVALTPPGKAAGESTKIAKKRGEITVRSDLNRLFKPVPKKQADTDVGDLFRYHEGKQNRKGRVYPNVKRRRVYRADLNKVIKENLADVGKLAGGWNAAASRLGAKVPAWIKRHTASPGAIQVQSSEHRVKLVMINKVRYASQITNLEARLKRALGLRLAAIQRQLEEQVKKGLR